MLQVHRHGDRTPVEGSISYSTDPDEVELRSDRYGFGQLTDVSTHPHTPLHTPSHPHASHSYKCVIEYTKGNSH